MGLICLIAGHSWENGRCRRCGVVHTKHQWERMAPKSYQTFSKCLHRCTVCEKREVIHKWKPVDGRCFEICTLCGEGRYLPHHFENEKCLRCGELEHPPKQELTYEERMTNADEGIFNGGVRGS